MPMLILIISSIEEIIVSLQGVVNMDCIEH